MEMMDREKVIKTIEGCINDDSFCNKCDYDGCVFQHGSCEKDLLADAIALLKEQEAVEPEVDVLNEIDRLYRCPKCHKHFLYKKQKYCDQCGQAAKWE